MEWKRFLLRCWRTALRNNDTPAIAGSVALEFLTSASFVAVHVHGYEDTLKTRGSLLVHGFPATSDHKCSFHQAPPARRHISIAWVACKTFCRSGRRRLAARLTLAQEFLRVASI